MELITAIQAAINADTNLPNSFLSRYPDNAELPVCVLVVISNVPDYETSDEYGVYHYEEIADVQIDVWGKTDGYVRQAKNWLDALFNRKELTLSDDEFIAGERVSELPARIEEQAWRYTGVYRFWVERST